jgi:glycosyltransferase involved in cell wall biosynthesis
LISIIIATFNAGKYIHDCLTSIIEQTADIEVIVIDGGSTDDTVAILKSFEHRLRLQWVSEQDAGIYDAMNKGIQRAAGSWIYFLGADDRLLPGFSELAALLKDEHTVYYGNNLPYYGNQEPNRLWLNGKIGRYALAKRGINHQSIIYPAKVFKKYRYELRYRVYADYALNIRVWGDRAFKKKHFPITIVRYDMTGFSSIPDDHTFKQDRLKIIRESMGWGMYLRMLYKRCKEKLQGEGGYWDA